MSEARPPTGLSRELIALRAARELETGSVVNLGIGLPTLVAGFVEPSDGMLFQAENGILGYSGVSESDFDSDLINAGGQPVDLVAGASFFDHRRLVRHDPAAATSTPQSSVGCRSRRRAIWPTGTYQPEAAAA